MCPVETLDVAGEKWVGGHPKVRKEMLRNILGQEMKDGEMRLKCNIELYETEGVFKQTRKRRIQFYGYLLRIYRNKMTKNLSVSSDEGRNNQSGFEK